jgi:membrane-bound serine protease (ClpP class)
MDLLLDPNVAYVLLVSGFVLAVLALFSPGTVVLEIFAVFALFLAGYVMYKLPTNTWALILLIVGVFPFLIALRRSRNWIFLVISLAALIIGTIFIFRTESGAPAIHPVLAIFMSVTATGILWFIGRKGIEAIEQALSIDLGQLEGMVGDARTDIKRDGTVYVNGEEWSARSAVAIKAGSIVRVISREGLLLIVEVEEPPE